MSRRITAAELMTRLSRNSSYVAMMEAKERAAQERLEQLQIEQLPLLQELSDTGVVVTSVWDLVSMKSPYPRAIAPLVIALSKPYSRKIIEGIIRALTVREARGQAGGALLKLFTSLPPADEEFRWLIANALTLASAPDMRASLEELAAVEEDALVRKTLDRAIASIGNEPRGTPK